MSSSLHPCPGKDEPLTGQGQAVLGSLLQQLSDERYSGRLDILGAGEWRWSFYLCLGRLVWQAGGFNAHGRWRRLLSQYCPTVDDVEVESLAPRQAAVREYAILAGLLQRQYINRSQLVALVEASLQELLFDLLQYLQVSGRGEEQVTYQLHPADLVQSPLTLIRSEQALSQARAQWQQWQAAGLTTLSPNRAVVLAKPQALQKQDPILCQLLQERPTLRELALKSQQDLISLTQTLKHYVDQGIVTWAGDPPPASALPAVRVSQPVGPLLVCIDDSPLICQSLEAIVTPLGYRFQAISDPLQALPSLLKQKPDLIFLDLVMPIVNGYELCSQIRRVASLKQVPVIILTGNLLDRMRASMVGATDCLPKPVDRERITGILQKYVPLSRGMGKDA